MDAVALLCDGSNKKYVFSCHRKRRLLLGGNVGDLQPT